MSIGQKIKNEIKTLVLLTVYFSVWIGVFVVLKKLILKEYHVQFQGWSMILVGALVLSKVVSILEHVSLGSWAKNRPAIFDVVIRTVLYSLGVFIVMVLEKSLEGRHEYGGFIESMKAGFEQADMYHVIANTICASGALLVYNMLSVIRRNLGEGGLLRIFLAPIPEESQHGIASKL